MLKTGFGSLSILENQKSRKIEKEAVLRGLEL